MTERWPFQLTNELTNRARRPLLRTSLGGGPWPVGGGAGRCVFGRRQACVSSSSSEFRSSPSSINNPDRPTPMMMKLLSKRINTYQKCVCSTLKDMGRRCDKCYSVAAGPPGFTQTAAPRVFPSPSPTCNKLQLYKVLMMTI